MRFWGRIRRGELRAVLGLAVALSLAVEAQAQVQVADLTDLSIEELMQVEVTLPSRHPESWALASSAVYVITQEDIRRSGVTNIPDALRLAPGVQVARATSSQWAVGVRGFASRLARSVLVLMDGRSVYNPLFAGTYWEVQDTPLEDIDHIEVIRGPSGALWGSNAFNGVINIVTKSAADTQGVLAEVGGGTDERGFATVRYGGRVGPRFFYRVYGKYFDRTAFPNPTGENFDDWQVGRGGFRVDWTPDDDDNVVVLGDAYAGDAGEGVGITHFEPPFFETKNKHADLSGASILGRWTHAFSPTSDVVVQTWYDHPFRRDPNFTEERNTFDLDAQHRFALPWNQEFAWGLDYRVTDDNIHAVETIQFEPPRKVLHLLGAFLQDDVWIIPDRLRLTIGSKFEYTTYTDFDYQPSGSILWRPFDRHSFWASISRAVRTPSRIEHDLLLTARPLNLDPNDPNTCLPAGSPCTYPRLVRNPHFDPEKIVAYQLGYRTQPVDPVFVDVAAFYNDYDDLLSLETGTAFPEAQPPLPHVVVPFAWGNGLDGKSYGAEIALTVQAVRWWRVTASYSYVHIDLDAPKTSLDPNASNEGSPQNQVGLLSAIDALWGIQLDSTWRYVDSIRANGQDIPSYVSVDVRAARHLTENLELSLVGQNLWEHQHREFFPGSAAPRGFYGSLRYRW